MSGHAEERRRAFTGLLAAQVVTRAAHPELWALVRRHQPVLRDWFADRLGYRLAVGDDNARLYRLPLDGAIVAPARPRPESRRVLVLALLAAVCAEDADDLTTVQDLSDRVRTLAARDDAPVSGYDPDRFNERRLFAKAVELLARLGALHPTGQSGEEMLTGWAHRKDAIGGAYRVQREPLLRLADPESLAAAVGRPTTAPEPLDGRRFSIMRRLLELPVCLIEDLAEDERAYLTSQRGRLLDWCREMTGWTVEQRREGIALIPAEGGTDRPFPELKAEHFGALMVLDGLLRESSGGTAVTRAVVGDVAGDVAERYPKAMTKAFRADPGLLADASIVLLTELDLLRPSAHGWRLTPPAARFRGPTVVATQPRMEGEQ